MFHQGGTLPTELRFFLGGIDNLRGYSRYELPENGLGALTSFYLGIENRFPSFLPWNLEPLVFSDFGNLSQDSLTFSSYGYASPGIGLRLNSPIGVFRATLARGVVLGTLPTNTEDKSHWQFYFGYGQEF